MKFDSFYLKYSQLKKEEFNTIYWDNPDYIYRLPDSINNHRLIFSNSIDKLDLYHKNGNKLIYHSIFPQFEDGLLKIRIVPYIVLEDEGKLMFVLSDWTDVFFMFDCNNKRWKYFKTENGGI